MPMTGVKSYSVGTSVDPFRSNYRVGGVSVGPHVLKLRSVERAKIQACYNWLTSTSIRRERCFPERRRPQAANQSKTLLKATAPRVTTRNPELAPVNPQLVPLFQSSVN